MMITDAEVRVDAGVSSGPREVLVLSIGDVLVRSRITILLCKTKINYIHKIPLLAKSHEKVVGFYVSMNEVLRVDELNSSDLKTKANGR